MMVQVQKGSFHLPFICARSWNLALSGAHNLRHEIDEL